MGFFEKLFGRKVEPEKPESVHNIQKILDKPWSEVTEEDRKNLCQQDKSIRNFSVKISPEVANRLIEESEKNESSKKIVEITAIGNTEPICPYCNYRFDKMPQRKKKCPNCNNFFYSQARPLDNRKVLIREDQLREMGAQRMAKYEQSLPKSPEGSQSISEKAIQAQVQKERGMGLIPTFTWVIPTGGCPIEAHRLLDGQTVDAGDSFIIPSGKWKGYKTMQPNGFGEPALDNKCRCWVVGGVRKK
jgi:hypothetical protein